MIIALRRMQLFPWTEQFSFFIERRCIRKPWYFCVRFPHSTRLRFRTHFRILTLLHQIRFWNQGSCNFPLDQRWFRFELPRLLVLGKNLLQILHGCVFFPFFQARSCSSVEKVDTWCFTFFSAPLALHKSFFSLINLLAKKFLCICHPLSPHKFSDYSLHEWRLTMQRYFKHVQGFKTLPTHCFSNVTNENFDSFLSLLFVSHCLS